MAVITINMGGRPMSIDVPDFAMESTQQDVANAIRQLQGAITGLEASNEGVSSGERQLIAAVKDLENEDSFRRHARAVGDGVKKGFQAAGRAPEAMVKQASGPGMMTSFLRSAGLGMLATQLGMVTGAAKELASVYAFGGSVGLSFGGDILATAEKLQTIGLQLDQFGDIVGQNLPVMRGLGANTEEGSQRFIDVVGDFRTRALNEAGGFGMASAEMAQFMAEELELRRQIMTQDQLQAYVQQDLTNAMMENFTEQEKMAKITGQNVRDRIRAQMEMKADLRVQLASRNMTEKQLKSVDAVTAGLSQFSPEFQKIIKDTIAVGVYNPALMATTEGFQMAQRDTSGSVMAFIQQAVEAARSGRDIGEVGNQMADLAQDIKSNIDYEQLGILAIEGNDRLSQVLLTSALKLNEQQEKTFETKAKLDTEQAKAQQAYINSIRSLQLEIDEQLVAQQNLALRTILGMAGGDTKDLVGGMKSLIELTTEALTSNPVKGLVDGFARAYGEMALMPFTRVLTGDRSEGENNFLADQAKVIGMFGQGMGFLPQAIAAGLQLPSDMRAGGRGIDAAIRKLGPEFILEGVDRDGDGKDDIDYNALTRAFGNATFALAQTSINKLADLINS